VEKISSKFRTPKRDIFECLLLNMYLWHLDGVVNVIDLKSIAFGRACSNHADVDSFFLTVILHVTNLDERINIRKAIGK
jgi:hypothetical protein